MCAPAPRSRPTPSPCPRARPDQGPERWSISRDPWITGDAPSLRCDAFSHAEPRNTSAKDAPAIQTTRGRGARRGAGLRGSTDAFRPFLRRQADLRVRDVDRLPDPRLRRLRVAAGLAVSRDRAADGDRARLLSGRQRRDGGRHHRDADRAGGQRRRQHALHDLAVDQRRQHAAHRHVQGRHQPRYRQRLGAEPALGRTAAPAAGRTQPRRHRSQGLARPDAGRAPALAQQDLRPELPRQLHLPQRPRRAPAPRRGRRHHDLRRQRVRRAHLGRPQQARRLRPLGHRGDDGPAGAERAGRGRPAQRPAGRQGRGVPARRAVAGALQDARGVRRGHHQGPGRAPRAGQGHRPRRDGPEGLHHELVPQRHARRRHRRLPAPRH